MSTLFARRAASRASHPSSPADSAPSPHLPPIHPGAILPSTSLLNFPWHHPTYTHTHLPSHLPHHHLPTHPHPLSHTPSHPLALPNHPPCPIPDHTTCPHGRVYYYASSYSGHQQRTLLEQTFGAGFFDYGNPPPGVWAALYRVLSGGVGKEDLRVLYAYRVSHCPRRRGQILGMLREGEAEEEDWEGEGEDWNGEMGEEEEEMEEMEEEEEMRVEMERLGFEDEEGEMGKIDEVMRG